MLKLMKMRTEDNKWIIEDERRTIVFDSYYDAWQYVFLMKEIRQHPPIPPRSVYPVLTLDPTPSFTPKKKFYRLLEECNNV
jgi:hypothetical protein